MPMKHVPDLIRARVANRLGTRPPRFGPGIAIAVVLAAFGPASLAAAADPPSIDPLVLKAEQQRIAAVERAMPSTVSVFVPGGGGGGSGVLISEDGYALTNFHVSSPAGAHMRCGLSDGNIYDAVIVGIDPVGDLALIRLLGREDFPAATMADSRLASPGDWCMVIGNPFLLATNLKPTVTYGILSGVGRYQYPSGTLLEYGDCLQTDASINPGNSGGPLFNADGELLGIVGRASFEKRDRVNVGVGFAISIHQAKNFLGYLHSGRVVDHATLGATVATDADGGVSVSNILESSDAYRRGLRYGAEILEIDGRPVTTANELLNVLATLPSKWRVKLRYRHEGETVDTLVRLASVHRPDELLEKMAAALPPPPPRRPGGKSPPGDPDGDGPSPLPKDPDAKGEDNGDPSEDAPSPHGAGGEAELPDAVRQQFESREGYANYHFNRIHQDRFIESLRTQFPIGQADQAMTWVIEGTTVGQPPEPVSMRIASDSMTLRVGDLGMQAVNKLELYEGVEARTLGGVLPALDAWRRMLRDGPGKFGETYYFGTMPLGGERPLRDCVVALDGDMEVRWLNHPESRAVEVVEVFAGRDSDPAELWLHREGKDLSQPPSRLELRYGLESVLDVKIESWKSEPATSEPAGPAAAAEDDA